MTLAFLVLTLSNGTVLTSAENTQDPAPFNGLPLAGRPTIPAGGIFDVADWRLGATNTISYSTTSGAGAGKLNFESLVVSRNVDLLSPNEFGNAARGRTYKYADLYLGLPGDNGAPIIRWIYGTGMTLATKLEWSEGEVPLEVVTFTFGQLWVGYRPRTATGSLGRWQVSGWDRIKNAATP